MCIFGAIISHVKRHNSTEDALEWMQVFALITLFRFLLKSNCNCNQQYFYSAQTLWKDFRWVATLFVYFSWTLSHEFWKITPSQLNYYDTCIERDLPILTLFAIIGNPYQNEKLIKLTEVRVYGFGLFQRSVVMSKTGRTVIEIYPKINCWNENKYF